MSSGALRHRKVAVGENSDIAKHSVKAVETNRTTGIFGASLSLAPNLMTTFGLGIVCGALLLFVFTSFRSTDFVVGEGRTSLAFRDTSRSGGIFSDSLGERAEGGYDFATSVSGGGSEPNPFGGSLDDMPEKSFMKLSSSSSQASFDSNLGKQLIDSIDQSIDDITKNRSNETSRMLVHNGNMNMKTWYGTLNDQVDKIQSLIQRNKGYIESKSFYTTHQQRYEYYNAEGYPTNDDNEKILRGASLSIRIPNDKFFDIIHTIQYEIAVSLDMIPNIDTNSVDVTEQYVDVMTRADVLDASRTAFKNLLLNKAESVSDILEIQKHIDNLTSDIESYRSRGQSLRNQSQLSTLQLSIVEVLPKAISNEQFDPSKYDLLSGSFNALLVIQKALHQTKQFSAVFGSILIYGLVVCSPLALLIFMLFHTERKISKRGTAPTDANNV